MSHDSFLEDLGLVGSAAEKITTGSAADYLGNNLIITKPRKSSTPEFVHHRDEITILSEKLTSMASNQPVSDDINIVKEISNVKKRDDKSYKSSRDSSKYSTPKIRSAERRVGNLANKLKLAETVDRSPATPITPLKDKLKTPASKENRSRFSDGSSKENSRSSVENITQSSDVLKDWRKVTINDSKNKPSTFVDEKTLLNSISDIVTNCTRNESNKIMKMMQDLYINSQSNLVKQLILNSEYLESDSDSPRIKALADENQRLLENIDFLKSRVEELQKMVYASDKIYQENVALKLRIKELEK